jgi:hypothetical protein
MRRAKCRMPKRDAGLGDSNLLMDIELPEDLCCVQEMLVLKDPAKVSVASSVAKSSVLHILLAVPCQQWQVQNERDPVSVDQEKEGKESVYGSFGDDVGVKTIAKIDRVDVVAGKRLACRPRKWFAAVPCGAVFAI